MRKIISKKQEQKKQKRNQIILGVILIFVLFGSVFGIVANSFGNKQETESIKYNGYEFTRSNNYYLLEIGSTQFYFLGNPNEISELEREINMTRLISSYIGKVLYLDSKDSTSSQEIYQNLNNYVGRIQPACIDELDCPDENLPIKTCEDNLIIIKEAENNKVYELEKCIFIQGKKQDLVKLTDEFIFNLIGLN